MTKKRRKLVASLIFIIATTSMVSAFAYAGLFNFWQLKLSDLFQPAIPVSNDIVIVQVDENSIDATNGLGSFENWSRSDYAQVLNNINKFHPKVVAFDFFFKTPKDTEGDLAFRHALAASVNPVIFYRMMPVFYDPRGFYVQKEGYDSNPLPLQILSELKNITISAARNFADKDEVYRRIMPLVSDEKSNDYYENFAFAIARLALDGAIKPSSPQVTPDSYTIDLKTDVKLNIPLEEGQMLINYASIPITRTYPNISFIDVYNGNFETIGNDPEKFFKDKIVIIGPVANYFKDFYKTPTVRAGSDQSMNMNGIEIHANALQTILDRAFLRNFTPFEQYGLIFLLCLASVFAFMYTKIRWSLLYLVAVPAAYTIAAPFAFKQGLILDLVHPYIALIISFMTVYVYRYLTEFKEKMAIKGAFGKYVNPQLAEQIAEHPEQLKLGGEKRTITVLFTDIAHFTTISEKLAPESTVALLNEYFGAMSKVVMDEGGTLDKFEGDAIMAFFGAPISQSDHAARAVRAALNMRESLADLVKKWQTDPPLPGGEKKPFIDARCGLSTGEAIVGNIGSSARFDYTAIGDIVNLGSRLEGANKVFLSSIMASEATYNLVKDLVVARVLDKVRVQGKEKVSEVFEILGLKDSLTPELSNLLKNYAEGVEMFRTRKFAEGLAKFDAIVKQYPDDGPSKMYRQWCEVYRNFPPKADWDGVFELGSK